MGEIRKDYLHNLLRMTHKYVR